jgi:hypothetical protein
MAGQEHTVRIVGLAELTNAIASLGQQQQQLEPIEPPTALADLMWFIAHGIPLMIGQDPETQGPLIRIVAIQGIRGSSYKGPLERALARARQDVENQIGGKRPPGV